MAEVRMKVYTGWGGMPLKPGDTIDVEPIVAKRWAANNIAEIVKTEVSPPDDGDYSSMSLPDLKELAKAAGITGVSRTSKGGLIALLEGADAAEDEMEEPEVDEEEPEIDDEAEEDIEDEPEADEEDAAEDETEE